MSLSSTTCWRLLDIVGYDDDNYDDDNDDENDNDNYDDDNDNL